MASFSSPGLKFCCNYRSRLVSARAEIWKWGEKWETAILFRWKRNHWACPSSLLSPGWNFNAIRWGFSEFKPEPKFPARFHKKTNKSSGRTNRLTVSSTNVNSRRPTLLISRQISHKTSFCYSSIPPRRANRPFVRLSPSECTLVPEARWRIVGENINRFAGSEGKRDGVFFSALRA